MSLTNLEYSSSVKISNSLLQAWIIPRHLSRFLTHSVLILSEKMRLSMRFAERIRISLQTFSMKQKLFWFSSMSFFWMKICLILFANYFKHFGYNSHFSFSTINQIGIKCRNTFSLIHKIAWYAYTVSFYIDSAIII